MRSKLAIFVLGASLLIAIAGPFFAPADYKKQFREVPGAKPTAEHLLGTDDLGRDRFSRLVKATQVSLLLAPSAALITVLLAGLLGTLAGASKGIARGVLIAGIDLFLSLPWLFLLFTVRAALPLNTSPETSVAITFLLLGCLGWPAAARIVSAGTAAALRRDFVLQAHAAGWTRRQILYRCLAPLLLPILFAQFWVSVPVFILAEANLSILGLGVAEPLPSWGSLLKELQMIAVNGLEPWKLGPVLLIVITVIAFQVSMGSKRESQA